MRKLLKVVCVTTLCVSLCFVGITVLLKGTADTAQTQKKKLLSQPDRVSSGYPGARKHSIEKSIASAVRVVSTDAEENGTSLATGTYFIYKGRYYVLTVAHAIAGPCEKFFIMYFEHSASCIDYVLVDTRRDYAIIETEEMYDRVPIRIPHSLKSKKYPKLLDQTYYTGYPNNSGPLTFTGTVAGFAEDSLILLQSYAWTGSSGSGVFDYEGNLIGIIMALDVGVTQHGVDVMENLLIVVPTSEIDWPTALHHTGN